MLAVCALVSLVDCLGLLEGLAVARYGALLEDPLVAREVADLQVAVVVLLWMAGCLKFISSCQCWSIETRLLTISCWLIE